MISGWFEGFREWLQVPVEGGELAVWSMLLIAVMSVVVVKALRKHVWEPKAEGCPVRWVAKCYPDGDPKPAFKGVIGSGVSPGWITARLDVEECINNHMVYGPDGKYWGELTPESVSLCRNVMVYKQVKGERI